MQEQAQNHNQVLNTSIVNQVNTMQKQCMTQQGPTAHATTVRVASNYFNFDKVYVV